MFRRDPNVPYKLELAMRVPKTQSISHLRAQRNAFRRGGRPQSRLFANIGIRMREILFARRISTTLLDGVDHHDFHQERAEPEAARGWVEHQATNLRFLRRFLITGSLNDASTNNVVGRPVQDLE